MERPKIKNTKKGPERGIQDRIMMMLRNKGWLVVETHGNMFSSGFPDLYATHSRYGVRWVEVKNAESYSFTPAQMEMFPKFCANGSGIWILVEATEDEYQKLWRSPNWHIYLSLLNQHSANISRIKNPTPPLTGLMQATKAKSI